MIVLAHPGHWAMWILYLLPVIVVGIAILTSLIRQRRSAPDTQSGQSPVDSR